MPRSRPTIPFGDESLPAEAPALGSPTLLAGLVARAPRATLSSQIGRWYDRAGGLDKAILAAQRSQAARDESQKVLDPDAFPKWRPEDVTSRTARVTPREPDELPIPNAHGMWHPDGGVVWVDKDAANKQAILEHELSHNAYVRDAKTQEAQSAAAGSDRSAWVVPHGGTPLSDSVSYLLDPAEADVRLAEIKRRYAHHTGRLVDSPEEAERAWKWYGEHSHRFLPPPSAAPASRPEDEPTMSRRQWNIYNRLPPTMRKQLMHRMPELVKSGGVLGGLS